MINRFKKVADWIHRQFLLDGNMNVMYGDWLGDDRYGHALSHGLNIITVDWMPAVALLSSWQQKQQHRKMSWNSRASHKQVSSLCIQASSQHRQVLNFKLQVLNKSLVLFAQIVFVLITTIHLKSSIVYSKSNYKDIILSGISWII